MRAPLSQFRPRRRPMPAEERATHVRMLTDVRDRLLVVMLRNGIPVGVQEQHEVTCRLHGVPWRSCARCSPARRGGSDS